MEGWEGFAAQKALFFRKEQKFFPLLILELVHLQMVCDIFWWSQDITWSPRDFDIYISM